jgi:hypothetical protein
MEQVKLAQSRWRGLASPDDGDALALTFPYPVAKRDWAEERRFEEGLNGCAGGSGDGFRHVPLPFWIDGVGICRSPHSRRLPCLSQERLPKSPCAQFFRVTDRCVR